MLAIGSSTVFPVTELLARKYEDRSTIVVPRSTGSSLGIRNLLAGGAAVGAASRPIKASTRPPRWQQSRREAARPHHPLASLLTPIPPPYPTRRVVGLSLT